MIYLNTYEPLVKFREVRTSICDSGIPPYVDRSIRREPDLESEFPSITTLCRADRFAPKLKRGDIAVYRTTKGWYPGYPGRHWRITAILKVIEEFESHELAAEWYQARKLPLPSNCMVPGNAMVDPALAKPLHRTRNQKTKKPHSSHWAWDAHYRGRATKWGHFKICIPLFRDLHNPPVHLQEHEDIVFGGTKWTLSLCEITEKQLQHLCLIHGIVLRGKTTAPQLRRN